jgi:cysteine desulfurase / selenocysteine lyase
MPPFEPDLAADRAAVAAMAERVRPDFPLLRRRIGDEPLTFMDSASTTPKPRQVIAAVTSYYETGTANVHRGVHVLGEEATRLYEGARAEVAGLIGASRDEIIFVRGTTEAINLVAFGLGLGPDDEVVFPASEHHSNWLPWRVRAKPVPIPIDGDGLPDWDAARTLLTDRTRLVSIGHVSNVTGTVAPVADVVGWAHARGVPVLLDAAQSLSHMPIDVRALGVDFLAASAHKAFGPSGIGLLYASRARMAKLPLYQVGGGMVAMNEDLGVGELYPRDPPFRFEAGTPAIEAAIGFGEAVRWMRSIGMQAIAEHDHALARCLFEGLKSIDGLRILARDIPAEERIALATFVVDVPAMTQENVARALSDRLGICVSGGYHCAHVLHARAKLAGTVRASPHLFNTPEEIDRLVEGLREIVS